MPTLPHAMLGPEHLIQGVTSRESYILAFERHVGEGRRRYPGLVWPRRWRSVAPVAPIVSGGSWKVHCATPGCGEFPLVNFAWGGLAVCFNCGATYDGIQPPADRVEIERILMNRPQPHMRNWNWPHPESVAVLRAQNIEMGDAA